jgi:hypothetical protein
VVDVVVAEVTLILTVVVLVEQKIMGILMVVVLVELKNLNLTVDVVVTKLFFLLKRYKFCPSVFLHLGKTIF